MPGRIHQWFYKQKCPYCDDWIWGFRFKAHADRCWKVKLKILKIRLHNKKKVDKKPES